MHSLPIMMTLTDRPVLVVGTTPIALSRARLVAQAGARVILVVGKEGTASLLGGLEGIRSLRLIRRDFEPQDVQGQALVFAATGDADLDAEVALVAREGGVPVNVADRPELCAFLMPAIVDRGPLVIALASGGAAPSLLTRLRGDLEAQLPQGLGAVVEAAGALRGEARRILPEGSHRRDFWRGLFSEAGLQGLVGLDVAEASAEIRRRMALARRAEAPQGKVLLVGAGPGDPELMTLKAVRALSLADVVIYDRLVNPAVLDYARRDAERIYVGKDPGGVQISQGAIDDLIVAHARSGRAVVRLKGGDPSIFGRGGEELERLRAEGIPVEVVPGVTAALGAAASAGFSLSHRALSSSVTLMTGTLKGGRLPSFKGLAGPGRTLVLYMGVRRASQLAQGLMDDGVPGDTPVAILERATQATERRIYGRLRDLGDLVRNHAVENPALLVVGEVSHLGHDALRAAAQGWDLGDGAQGPGASEGDADRLGRVA